MGPQLCERLSVLERPGLFPSKMPSILGLGLPADHVSLIDRNPKIIQRRIEYMENDMNSSPYEWEMLFASPEMNFDMISCKLQEKHWDIIMIGSKLTSTNNQFHYIMLIRVLYSG